MNGPNKEQLCALKECLYLFSMLLHFKTATFQMQLGSKIKSKLRTFDLPLRSNARLSPGKWVPASAGKAKAGMVHFVSGWTRGVQVRPWDPLRTRTCHTWAL